MGRILLFGWPDRRWQRGSSAHRVAGRGRHRGFKCGIGVGRRMKRGSDEIPP